MINYIYKDSSYSSNIKVNFNHNYADTLDFVLTGFFSKQISLPINIFSLVIFSYIIIILQHLVGNKLVSVFSLFSEKELNSIDDLLITTSCVFGFIGFYIFFMFGFFTGNSIYILSLFYLCSNLVLILLILITMMYNFNYYLIIFINGASGSLSLAYEFILDAVNLLAFNLRQCVQLVRIIILFSVYYMLSMIFYEVSHSYSSDLYIVDFLQTYLRLLFEVAHTLVIFVMQVGAFMFMVFWLFQFLMTCFSTVYHETSSYQS